MIDPAYIKAGTVDGDLISRQAAIDALRKMQTYKLFSGDDMLLIDQAGAQTELMMLPPAEPEPSQVAKDISRIVENGQDMRVIAQPEIIRCKDCKFWTHIKRTNRYWCKTDDGLYDLNPSPNDYCSRAERRTDEHSD